MPRTTHLLVKEMLGPDYDGARSLDLFIRTANAVTSRLQALATGNGLTITGEELLLIETWLGAYYYCRSDAAYTSRSNGGSSGSFESDGQKYRQGAVQLDPTGYLNAILDRKVAGLFWAGMTETELEVFNGRRLTE